MEESNPHNGAGHNFAVSQLHVTPSTTTNAANRLQGQRTGRWTQALKLWEQCRSQQTIGINVRFRAMKYLLVLQPAGMETHGSQLARLIGEPGVSRFDWAIAYVTNSGVTALFKRLEADEATEQAWNQLEKRFLVGIDWLRSEPTALARLAAIPRTKVRVHDGSRVVQRLACTPFTSWHPKVAFVHGSHVRGTMLGSGNLSRNGLEQGVEVGISCAVTSSKDVSQHALWDTLGAGLQWFDERWNAADTYRSLVDIYEERFANEAIQRGATTEEDTEASGRIGSTRNRMTPEMIRALRVSQNFWIFAGNITRNRGKSKPGDQLMMSAFMRVFFGFPAEKVPTNTPLGTVPIRHPDQSIVIDRPLRFSDNSMDVLTLPVPGNPWPSKYDQKCILFTKVTSGSRLEYRMEVGGSAFNQRLRTASQQQESFFTMSSGREWGIFG